MFSYISVKINNFCFSACSTTNRLQQKLAAARCDYRDRRPHTTLKGGLIKDAGARWGAKAATGWELGLKYIVGRGVKRSDKAQLMTPKLLLKQLGAPNLLVTLALDTLGEKLGVATSHNVPLNLFMAGMAGVRFLSIALPGACLMGLAYGIATALHIACVTACDASALLAKQGRFLRDKFGPHPGVPELTTGTV